jgi:hypothetical protein
VLARRMNAAQLLAALGLHLCYHIYASAAYASVMLATRLGLRSRAGRPQPAPRAQATEATR